MAVGELGSGSDCFGDMVADLLGSETLKVRARAGLNCEEEVADRLFDLPRCYILRRELRNQDCEMAGASKALESYGEVVSEGLTPLVGDVVWSGRGLGAP